MRRDKVDIGFVLMRCPEFMADWLKLDRLLDQLDRIVTGKVQYISSYQD